MTLTLDTGIMSTFGHLAKSGDCNPDPVFFLIPRFGTGNLKSLDPTGITGILELEIPQS